MRRRFFLLTITASVFLSGCVYLLFPSSSKSLSYNDEKPFCDLIQKEVKLLRPLKVYQDFYVELDEKEADSTQILWGKGIPDNLQELTKGTVVRFDSFWVEKDYAVGIPLKIRYIVWFTVPEMKLPDCVKFEYIWGRGLYLNRAPWEDESVPESRYVGFNGKSYSGE